MTAEPPCLDKVCEFCRGPIGDAPFKTRRDPDMRCLQHAHELCIKKDKAEREQREIERRLEQEKRDLERYKAYFENGVASALARLPPWAWADVDSPKFTEAVADEKLRAMAHNWTPDDGSLLLLGPTGIGKTSSVIATIRRHARDYHPELKGSQDSIYEDLHYWTPPHYPLGIFSQLLWTKGAAVAFARRNAPLGSEPELLMKAKAASLLIIDDATQEPIGDGGLFEVIDHRYEHHKPTIVTTGLSRTAFRERYGDALDRRLTQEGVGVALESPLKGAPLRAVK
jgi:DNA replication protein DnaC